MSTKIKLCGLRRECDIAAVNELSPDFIGFVFAKKSKRYIEPTEALILRRQLSEGIIPVGVFVNSSAEEIADIVNMGAISAVQLHGDEGEEFISRLRTLTSAMIIQAFKVKSEADIERANLSSADIVLLDSGAGTGTVFEHSLIPGIRREYLLAGGISAENVGQAILKYCPYGVDVSSAIETDGFKDENKMREFVGAVRAADNKED